MFFFFFKQKAAYEMRISDWSSDVCSSDLEHRPAERPADAGDAADHPSLFADDGGGGPARIAADRADRRRHDAERQRKAPRVRGPRQHQYRRRLRRRSEERVGGTECVSTCRSRWTQCSSKKKQTPNSRKIKH